MDLLQHGSGGLYLSRSHDQHPFCSEMFRKVTLRLLALLLGTLFARRLEEKKKRSGDDYSERN